VNAVNWLVVALVVLLSGGTTWVAFRLVTRYCDRFPETELDEEFP
jgi:hypothetical protein